MEILNELKLAKFKKLGFLPRKKMPFGKRLLLTGAPQSGKTYHLLNRANQSEGSSLYIDLSDFRINADQVEANLSKFCLENKITFLAIDNYIDGFVVPDQIDEIWLARRSSAPKKGFDQTIVFGLDFEEFIAFDKHLDDPKTSFDEFLKRGSFIENTGKNSFLRIKRVQEILSLVLPDQNDFAVFAFLLEKNGFILTPNQIYTILKERMKISKDRLYALVAKLEEIALIATISKLDAPRAPKKFFACDHAIRSAITTSKNLAKRFENMIFLEIIKHNKSCFYDDYIDFVIPEKSLAIIAQPFATIESIYLKSELIRQNQNIKKIEFITMGFEYKKEEDMVIEAVPFWIWALRESE